jgi:hypothetical protein
MGSKEGIMHISLAFFEWRWSRFDSDRISYVHISDNLVGAVPVYYDLKKETSGSQIFEALEKLDLTR